MTKVSEFIKHKPATEAISLTKTTGEIL